MSPDAIEGFPSGVDWGFKGTMTNVGNACATDVHGSILLFSETREQIAARGFDLQAGTIIRPGEHVEYRACCFSQRELDTSVGYKPIITFSSVPCP